MNQGLNPLERELYDQVSAVRQRAQVRMIAGGEAPYIARPNHGEMNEPQKRWLSWNFLVETGRKKSYTGTADPKKVAKRRAKNKAARKTRQSQR